MEFLETFQLNVYTVGMLIILFGIISNRLQIETYGKKLLLLTIVFTTAALINEPIAWEFDGAPSTAGYVIEYVTNMFELLFGPIISALMLQYVSYQANHNRKPILRMFVTFPPIIFTVLMLIINVFTPIYFRVDPTTHQFSVGSLIWIQYVMIVITYIYMVGYTFYNRKKLERYKIWIFYVFFLLPIIGMFIQLMNSRIFLSWTSIALSILVVYVFLEATDGERDHLTKLFNRRSYETYITQKMELLQPFKVLYIDLDGFKHINDFYGHVTGDYILVAFSELLQKVFKTQLNVRLGGDEFIVVCEIDDPIDTLLDALQEEILECPHDIMATVHFSYGVQEHQPGVTIDELYNLVDKKMYDYKRKNKTLKRRQTD